MCACMFTHTHTRFYSVTISSQIKVIKGPSGQVCQAQNLLNMVTPALFPAGSNAPMITLPETSSSPGQLVQMQPQHLEQTSSSSILTPVMSEQGSAVVEVDRNLLGSSNVADGNKPSKFEFTFHYSGILVVSVILQRV